jgi:HEAT repeat protein
MLASLSRACNPGGMGKRHGIILVVLFIALAGGLVWMLSRPSEPLYQGKPLSAWINEYNGRPGDTNQAALVAIREMGTNAIPTLLKIMESDDPPFQRMMSELNRKQSLVHFPVREKPYPRWAASAALYAMGASARPAFPTLTNLLFHANSLFKTAAPANALAGMGSGGLPPLLAALTNQNPFIRSSAATGLGWARSDLNIVVPALIARLGDRDWWVHCEAVLALGHLHAEPELAVPALMKDYPGNDPKLRSEILRAIGRFETNASAAVPMLLETLSDNDPEIRHGAAWALKHIDSEAAAKAGVK